MQSLTLKSGDTSCECASDPDVLWCAVHRVLTAAGLADAKRLMQGQVTASNQMPAAQTQTWLEADSPLDAIGMLVESVAEEQPLRLESPHGLLVSGCCGVDFPDQFLRCSSCAESESKRIDATS